VIAHNSARNRMSPFPDAGRPALVLLGRLKDEVDVAARRASQRRISLRQAASVWQS
jgi:hypothetical protein